MSLPFELMTCCPVRQPFRLYSQRALGGGQRASTARPPTAGRLLPAGGMQTVMQWDGNSALSTEVTAAIPATLEHGWASAARARQASAAPRGETRPVFYPRAEEIVLEV